MSPYENLLRQESIRRVGLFALAKPGMEERLLATALPLGAFASMTLQNVHVYYGRLDGRTAIFVYLETLPTDLDAIPLRLCNIPRFSALIPFLEIQPGAKETSTPWVRMELINVVGRTRPEVSRQAQNLGYVSQLLPDHELSYRTLHQTNWPGVVDQMSRSHYRYWVTFLAQIGPNLTLFTYCQYVGQDKAADDRAMAADPTTQRWWKHIQPCLCPPDGGANSWTELKGISVASAPADAP